MPKGQTTTTIGEVIKQIEEFNAEVEKKFYKYYGHYESVSGRAFFQVLHNEGDIESGSVIFRKGETNNPKLEEDCILSRRDAMEKFGKLYTSGFTRVYEGTTTADIEKALKSRSTALDDILGIFYYGKMFLRIDNYGGKFSIQRGYDGTMTEAEHEKTEADAREAVESAIKIGYSRSQVEPVKEVQWMNFDLNL
jgi:hypothetical protein